MDEPASKAEILGVIRPERDALTALLGGLNVEQLPQPGVESDWSVKDILAHISDWEQRMVDWIEASLRGEVPEQPAPGMTWDDLDRLNERTYLLNKERALDDVLATFESSYRRSLTAVEALSEKEFIDPKAFAWRKGDPPWHMVAANTWWHYKEHRETISNWLKESV